MRETSSRGSAALVVATLVVTMLPFFPAPATADAPSVTATINLGTGPVDSVAVAVNPSGSQAYVANYMGNSISVINTVTNTVLDTITGVSTPYAVSVTPSGGYVYVANYVAGTVSVIDTVTMTVLDTISVGVRPTSISFSPDGQTAFVSDGQRNSVYVVSTDSKTVTDTITIQSLALGSAMSPDGTRLYVPNYDSNTVSVIDTVAKSITDSYTVGGKPRSVAISPDGNWVWVSNSDSNTVSAINVPSRSRADVWVGSSPSGIAISPDGALVFVTNSLDDSVSVIEAASRNVVRTIRVGDFPQGIAASPSGSSVYVANQIPSTVSVISVLPWMTSISRTTGPASGGTTITLNGARLNGTTAVTFGGAAGSITSNSASSITVTTPGGSAGSVVDIVVTTPAGTDTKTAAFAYTGPRTYAGSLLLNDPLSFCPQSLGFSPDSRWAYLASCVQPSAVTVIDVTSDTPTVSETITGFTAGGRIGVAPDGSRVYTRSSASNALWTISVDGNTRTLIDTQTGTGIVDFAVSSQGRTMYAVLATNPSILKQFDLATGTPGTATTISTLSIGDANTITIDRSGSSVVIAHRSLGIISFVDLTKSPAAVETVTVGRLPQFIAFSPDGSRAFVTNYGDGTVSLLHVEDGRISSVDTITGLPGAWAVAASPDGKWIYVGSRERNVIWKINAATEAVADALAVDWDGNAAEIITSLTFTPDGNYLYATHQDHSKVYAFRNPPSITASSAATGGTAGGSSVRISGFGFTGATAVTFGGVAASSFTVDSATQITAITPPGTAGAVSIVVTGPGGSDTKTAGFTYVAPTPPSTPAPVAASAGPVASLTSITPSTGPTSGGTLVTITGSNLGSVNGVTFDGNAATSLTVVDSTRITAVTPAGVAGPANVMVSMPGSTASFGAVFTYIAPTPPTTDTGTSSGSTTSSGTATTGGSETTTTTTAVRTGAALATFATKSSILSTTDRKTIQRLVTTSGMDARYRIKGHSSSNASAQTLARARARAIQRLLIELGVAYSRISTEFNSKVAKQVQLVALKDR